MKHRSMAGFSEAWRIYALFCMRSPSEAAIKIGVSSTIYQRLLTLQTGLPYPMGICLHSLIGDRGQAMRLEAALHRAFAHRNTRGEWFAFDLSSEADKREFHDTVRRVNASLFDDLLTWEKIHPEQLAEYASMRHIEDIERGRRKRKPYQRKRLALDPPR